MRPCSQSLEKLSNFCFKFLGYIYKEVGSGWWEDVAEVTKFRAISLIFVHGFWEGVFFDPMHIRL